QHRAEGTSSIQGTNPRNHEPNERSVTEGRSSGTKPIPRRLAGLLWLLRDTRDPAESGRMASKTCPCLPMEAMEDVQETPISPHTTRSESAGGHKVRSQSQRHVAAQPLENS